MNGTVLGSPSQSTTGPVMTVSQKHTAAQRAPLPCSGNLNVMSNVERSAERTGVTTSLSPSGASSPGPGIIPANVVVGGDGVGGAAVVVVGAGVGGALVVVVVGVLVVGTMVVGA